MADTNPNETIYIDQDRGSSAQASTAKLRVQIQGVTIGEDTLTINFTDSVSGTFDPVTGTATIPITPGAQQAPQWTITGRISSGIGILENFDIALLEDDTEPSDIELLGKRTGDGNLVKVGVGNLPTGGGGEANLAANVGTGSPVFRDKVGVTFNFRSPLGTEILEDRINGDDLEIGFKDTSQLNFVGRADSGAGKPTFVMASNAVFKKAFQSNFQSGTDVTNPGRALTNADYKAVIDLDTTTGAGGQVTITLPDATGLTEPATPIDRSMPWCWLRVLSAENLAIVTTAVTDELRSFNGYGDHNDQADTIYLGLSQGAQRNMIIPIYRIGTQWNIQGQIRDTADLDLTLDGPLEDVTRSTATESLINTDLGNKMAIFDFAGAVALNVAGCTDLGKGIEIYKTTAGDITVTGGIGSTTIPSGEGRLLRVIPTGAYIS